MNTIEAIEDAVRSLTADQFRTFRAWLEEYEADLWDRQIEEDAAAGRLDHLADEALADLRAGRCTDL